MKTLLTQIAALAKPRHPLSDVRDLITNGCIEAADAIGFSVIKCTGTERVEFPFGMTPETYCDLAQFCSHDERGILAKGVLENLLTVDWHTWDRFQCVFYRATEQDIEEWLPGAVEEIGFQAVAAGIKKAIAQLPPLPPKTPILRQMPTGFLLQYGHNEWTFSNHASTTGPILKALQSNKWEPVTSIEAPDGILDEMQVKQAVYQLNHITAKVIGWHTYTTIWPRAGTGRDTATGPFTKKGELKTTGVWWKSLL
jgi:hypothetical protein